MSKKSKNKKIANLRLILALGLCVILFAATNPSDDICAEFEHTGSVRVDNNKNYKVEVWIGDYGPFTCPANYSSVILHVKPGNHVYVWLSVPAFQNERRKFGGGTVLVKEERQSVIVIPND